MDRIVQLISKEIIVLKKKFSLHCSVPCKTLDKCSCRRQWGVRKKKKKEVVPDSVAGSFLALLGQEKVKVAWAALQSARRASESRVLTRKVDRVSRTTYCVLI